MDKWQAFIWTDRWSQFDRIRQTGPHWSFPGLTKCTLQMKGPETEIPPPVTFTQAPLISLFPSKPSLYSYLTAQRAPICLANFAKYATHQLLYRGLLFYYSAQFSSGSHIPSASLNSGRNRILQMCSLLWVNTSWDSHLCFSGHYANSQ